MLGAGRDNHQECLWAKSSLNRTFNQHISNALICIEKIWKGWTWEDGVLQMETNFFKNVVLNVFLDDEKFEIDLPKSFPQLLSPQNTPCRRTTKTMEPIICPWGYASFKMVFPLHASKTPCDLFVLFIPWCLKVFQITFCLYPWSTSLCWKCLETIYMQFDSKEPFRS